MLLFWSSQLVFFHGAFSEDDWEDGVFVGERISTHWKRGRHLIYDCVEKSYICVDREGYEQCERNRIFYKVKDPLKTVDLFCSPLKSFEKSVDCFAEQDKHIVRHHERIFCQRELLVRLKRDQKYSKIREKAEKEVKDE
jgi:hypothetical protein